MLWGVWVQSVWCMLSGLRVKEFVGLHLKGLLLLVEPPDHNRHGVSAQSIMASIMGLQTVVLEEQFRTWSLTRAEVELSF